MTVEGSGPAPAGAMLGWPVPAWTEPAMPPSAAPSN